MPETESTLRDRLAVRRTALANERTLLAYVRTSVMLLASGATLWRLEPLSGGDRVLGAIAGVAGLLVALAGAIRFVKHRAEIEVGTPDSRG